MVTLKALQVHSMCFGGPYAICSSCIVVHRDRLIVDFPVYLHIVYTMDNCMCFQALSVLTV